MTPDSSLQKSVTLQTRALRRQFFFLVQAERIDEATFWDGVFFWGGRGSWGSWETGCFFFQRKKSRDCVKVAKMRKHTFFFAFFFFFGCFESRIFFFLNFFFERVDVFFPLELFQERNHMFQRPTDFSE